MDAKLCAAQSLSSTRSVVRAQLVVAEALHPGMQRGIHDMIMSLQTPESARSRVVCLNRLWDETALRVQMPEASMKSLLDQDFTARALLAKSSRNRAPGLVTQTFQQMAHLRWGPSSSENCELVISPKIIPGNGADCIFIGLSSKIPCLNPTTLDGLSKQVRTFVLFSFPDGLAANRVCMRLRAMMIPPRALILNLHCAAHLLQIVWESASKKTMSTPLYEFTQVMSNDGRNAEVQAAMESLASSAEIVVGVPPRPQEKSFNECIL